MGKKTDLRILKTRKALSDAFLVLLCEKRFEDITVGELCDRAMVRRATFYKHYADKYEFFTFFIRQYEETFSMDAKEHKKDSLSDYSAFMFQRCIEFMREHQQMIQRVLESNMQSVLLDLFTDEIYHNTLLHIRENNLFPNATAAIRDTIAAFYAGGIVQVLRQWFNGSRTHNLDEIHETSEALTQILHSFTNMDC